MRWVSYLWIRSNGDVRYSPALSHSFLALLSLNIVDPYKYAVKKILTQSLELLLLFLDFKFGEYGSVSPAWYILTLPSPPTRLLPPRNR